MRKQNPYLSLLGAGVAVLLLLISICSVPTAIVENLPTPMPSPTPRPTAIPTNTPTPQPTMGPRVTVTCVEGATFLGAVKQYLLEKYNLNVEYVRTGTFNIKTYPKLNQADCIWPGSMSAYEEFTRLFPGKVIDKEEVFSTYEVICTRKDIFLEDFLRYGVAYKNNNQYLFKMGVVVDAMRKDKTFAQMFKEQAALIGVSYQEKEWMRLPVNIAYPNPTISSGGLEHKFLLASYSVPGHEDGGTVVTVEDLEGMLPFLVKNFKSQPLQETGSPEWMKAYVAYSASYPLSANTESLFLGWYNSLSLAKQKSDGDLIVCMYPAEWTGSTRHMLAALTPNGVRLVQAFRNDPYLQEFGWNNLGMRTPFGPLAEKPGKTDVEWIGINVRSIGSPQAAAFDRLLQALKQK
jgi:hypothetical protein